MIGHKKAMPASRGISFMGISLQETIFNKIGDEFPEFWLGLRFNDFLEIGFFTFFALSLFL